MSVLAIILAVVAADLPKGTLPTHDIEQPDFSRLQGVWSLQRAVYGGKEVPKTWFKKAEALAIDGQVPDSLEGARRRRSRRIGHARP
jgi:hypothetical protein